MCGSKDDLDYAQMMVQYHDLVARRNGLIADGVSHERLLVPIRPRRRSETTALPYKAYTNLGDCQNNQDRMDEEHEAKKLREHEARLRLLEEHPLMVSDPLMSIDHTEEALANDRVNARAEAGEKITEEEYLHAALHASDPPDEGITREKIDAMSPEEIEEIGRPLAEYIYEPRPGTKDSNPKEAFGARKAGVSCIPTQVKYELGLAMLEGALKYGRHNYRIAGVRGSTYYDATNRHLDDWWEGEDLDPKSGAKLHHIIKGMASLAVLYDSILAGNWTDDRPPRIGNPKWLDWYNEQAEIMVDACKNPKPPFTELEHGKR
jgi:hypothetical protein